MKTINSIEKVNQLSENEFIGAFGNVFEKTNWIANKAFNSKPYKDFDEFRSKMITIYENLSIYCKDEPKYTISQLLFFRIFLKFSLSHYSSWQLYLFCRK